MTPRTRLATDGEILKYRHPGASRFNAGSGFYFVLILALLCVSVGGCSRKSKPEIKTSDPVEAIQNTPAPDAPTAAANPKAPYAPVSPQPLPPSSQAIAANSSAEAVTEQLTMELRRYVAYTRTIPKSFEDFVAHDPIKFPQPPAGKKYIITGGKVVLQ